MAVVISMLRGINVGGYHKNKMDALRALYESLGLRGAQTCLQSGNVIFRTEDRDLVALAKRIEKGIERSCGFRPDVILRTSSDLRKLIAANPFAKRRGIEPGKLLVFFLANDPSPEAQEKVLRIKTGPEELRAEGRELYIHFPNGQGRSKLSTAVIEKTLMMPGTGRNWNTVRKLLEIAEELEASQ
jgi:uncharacterized protein (DUF1697 family)